MSDTVCIGITGDLSKINKSISSGYLRKALHSVVDTQNIRHHDALAFPLTVTSESNFQGVTDSFARAASMVRDARLCLLHHGLECRFAVGLVNYRTRLNHNTANINLEPILLEIRKEMRKKSSKSLYSFVLPYDYTVGTSLNALSMAVTKIERNWTRQQFLDIDALISGETVSDIAKRRKVKVGNVYRVRRSGNFDLYDLCWNAVIESMAHLDRKYGLVRQ